MSRRLRNTAVLIIQPLVLNVLSVPATAFIVRVLGPLDFGTWSTGLGLATAIGFLRTLGVRLAFVRSAALSPEETPMTLGDQIGLRVMLGLLALVLATSASAALGHSPGIIACTLIASIMFLVSSLSTAVSDLFQARDELHRLAGANLFAGLVVTVSSVLAVAAGSGYIGIACCYLLGAIIVAILYVLELQKIQVSPRVTLNLKRFWGLIRDSRLLTAQAGIGSLAAQGNAVLIPSIVGISEYGVFAAGSMPVARLNIVTEAICSKAFPLMARTDLTIEARTRELARSLILAIGLTLPLAVGLTLTASWLAGILFPRSPDLCRMVVTITAWSLPLDSTSALLAYSLLAKGRDDLEVRLGIACSLTSLSLTLCLVGVFGVIGGCCAMALQGLIFITVRVPAVLQAYPNLLGQLTTTSLDLTTRCMTYLRRPSTRTHDVRPN